MEIEWGKLREMEHGDPLRDLVSFLQIKNVKKTMEECNCTKSITTPSVFFTLLLNCTNGTKLSKAFHIS